MRWMILGILLFMEVSGVLAQTKEGIDFIIDFLDYQTDDQIVAEDVEHFEAYLSRPLRINMCGKDKLFSSRLLSGYQIASLMRYRKEHGDILSFSELAALDGFGQDFTVKVKPFVSLESDSMAGEAEDAGDGFHGDAVAKASLKRVYAEDLSHRYSMKMRFNAADRFNMAISMSDLNSFSGYATWYFKRFDSKVILGDFNARFAQGLVLWNGMTMTGFASSSSFMKRPGGISQSWSFTGNSSLTGIASSLNYSNLVLSSFVAIPGLKQISEGLDDLALLPGLNLSWLGSVFNLSLTHYSEFAPLSGPDVRIPDMKTSLAAGLCMKGMDWYSEIAYDWVNAAPSVYVGTSFPVKDASVISTAVRYYSPEYSSQRSGAPRSGSKSSNELGFSIAGELKSRETIGLKGRTGFGSSVSRHNVTASLDIVHFPDSKSDSFRNTGQMKGFCTYKVVAAPLLTLEARFGSRFRNWEKSRWKNDFRLKVEYISGNFTAVMRADAVRCSSWGFLSYLESGLKTKFLSLHIRQGIFIIDNWEDRIYVCERGAPGNFSIPAFYGRGVWTSFSGSFSFRRFGKLYPGVSLMSYPLMSEEKKKPGKAELKIQYMLSF